MTKTRVVTVGKGVLAVAMAAFAAGCGDPSGECAVTPPEAWSAPDWDTNAAEAIALRNRVGALTGTTLMRGVETGAVTATAAEMNAMYEAGTPSLKSATSTSFDARIADVFEEFDAAIAAGAQDLVDEAGAWSPGAEGGVWTSQRAFNEGGLEVRQIVDKALFGGATLYNYALRLTEGEITPGTVDALAAAFGANPGLNPGRSNDENPENQNILSANYVHRMGHYAEAKQALIAAKAFAASGACAVERDAAIEAFFQTWERGLFARYLFYANSAAAALETAVTDEERSDALHELAEGLGLALGFHGVPQATTGPMSGTARQMTDARIATALSAMGLDVNADLGDATTGALVADLPALQAGLDALEDVIAEAYELSATDLAGYRAPTDG